MKITNRFGLSQAWVNAVMHDDYDKVGDYSMTQLNNPVRQQFLIQRHQDEIQEDVVDRIWMLLGSACHYVLEKAAEEGAITERRFCIPILGKQISMKPDRVEVFSRLPNGDIVYILKDFKITSLYACRGQVKTDWVKQCNGYAYGMRMQGYDVRHASIEALMKDWSYTECHVKKTYGYPKAQVQSLEVPMWDNDKCKAYLENRVRAFENNINTPDNRLPFCTEGERWAKGDRWAVLKEGGKKALPKGANFLTSGEAKQFSDTKNYPCKIEFRKEESVRCERYCPVKHVCNQYKEVVSKSTRPF